MIIKSKNKYRGWHTKHKRMFSAEEMAADQLTLLPTGEFINVSGRDTSESVIYPIDKFIPLQYTGLDDKNDTEIYEGDIVKLDSWEGTQQIKFIEGAFCLAFKDGQYAGDIHYIHHAGIKQATVIGNIYENPELLNENHTN